MPMLLLLLLQLLTKLACAAACLMPL